MGRAVHLFIPCYVDQYFPQVGIATAAILREMGCEPIYLPEQTCCGQPAFNSGYWKEAGSLAEHFLNLFADAETIVAPSGSCVCQIQKHCGDLPLSSKAAAEWQALSPRIFELSQFLVNELGIEQWEGYFPQKVSWHDACHGLRELGIRREPRVLLQSISGLELQEMQRSETCCGFGGTFAVKFAEISTAMAENKTRWMEEGGAAYLVSADSSCLMHLDGYLRRQKSAIKAIHLAELLWQARQQRDSVTS